jgi:hypothetical protein
VFDHVQSFNSQYCNPSSPAALLSTGRTRCLRGPGGLPGALALVVLLHLGRPGERALDGGGDPGTALLGRRAAVAADGHIRMDPVLGLLGLGDALDEQQRADAVGVDSGRVLSQSSLGTPLASAQASQLAKPSGGSSSL